MSQAPSSAAPSAAQEWRMNWLLVLSAMAGVSLGTVPSATLGLFMAPLQAEFGWSRTEISSGLTLFAIVSLPLVPFAGAMVDKFGARRVALLGIGLSGLVFSSFSLLGAMLFQWFAIWFAYTIVSLMTRTLVFSSAISRAFLTGRGFAIAVLLIGTAIAQSLAPVLSHWLIESYGWRTAYVCLGLGWGGFAFVLLLAFFHEPGRRRDSAGVVPDSSAAAAPGGLTAKQAFRNPAMLRIAIAAFLQGTMAVGVMVHLVPLLTLTGLTRAEAAGTAAILGIFSVVGKLVTGTLVDRFSGGFVPAITFSGPALGYLILWQGSDTPWLIPVGVAVLGYCSGACFQLTTYLTTRYAGLANFGAIFGIVSSLLAVTAGLGPLIAGAIFDLTGSYEYLLMAGIPAGLLAGIAVFGLGPYPDFTTADDSD
ncbi:MAG: MFS transporter [Novosphingobium sp.]|nr:MFS transporter [Novosphingobium sp.]